MWVSSAGQQDFQKNTWSCACRKCPTAWDSHECLAPGSGSPKSCRCAARRGRARSPSGDSSGTSTPFSTRKYITEAPLNIILTSFGHFLSWWGDCRPTWSLNCVFECPSGEPKGDGWVHIGREQQNLEYTVSTSILTLFVFSADVVPVRRLQSEQGQSLLSSWTYLCSTFPKSQRELNS